MVRQSPERAYDIGFFGEFARAVGWTERASLENPNCASRVDHRPICVRCEDMRAGDAAAPFVSWATRAKLLNHIRLSSQARCTLPMESCDLGPCTDGFR